MCELLIIPGLPIVYGQTVTDWLFRAFKPHLNRVAGVTYATRSLDRLTFNASLIGCLFYWPPGIPLSTREKHAAGMVKQGHKMHCGVAWTIGCHAWSSFRWYRWWMSSFLWQASFTLLHLENTKILWLKLWPRSWPCREFMTCCQMNDYCQPPFSACCFSLWLRAKLS